jgi:hypothetical protein
MNGKETKGCTWLQGVLKEEESDEDGAGKNQNYPEEKEKRNIMSLWPAASSSLQWNSATDETSRAGESRW